MWFRNLNEGFSQSQLSIQQNAFLIPAAETGTYLRSCSSQKTLIYLGFSRSLESQCSNAVDYCSQSGKRVCW